jgi:hypothetical protein
MTPTPNLGRELASWFDEQVTASPTDLLSRTLARVETIGQRPGFLTRDRYTGRSLRRVDSPLLAPAVLLLVLLLSAAVALVGSGLIKRSPSLISTTEGIWRPGDTVAFRAQLGPEVAALKWRAGTYAEYTGSGWAWGDVRRELVAAGEPMHTFGLGSDTPTTVGRRRVLITIMPEAFRDPTILGPNAVELVDQRVDAVVVGAGGWFTSIESQSGVRSYTVTALLPVFGAGPNDINEERLRTAGTDYPADLLSTYTTIPADAIGPAAMTLFDDIRGQAAAVQVTDIGEAGNAYDLARTTEAYLRSDRFVYDEDVRETVRNTCPADISTVECFAIIRRGYCEYFASTMAMFLRASGVPARIAYGFLPGQRNVDGLETINASAMHWWVEVYFPDIGWIEFDPTGGARGQPQAIPPGR